MSGVVTVSFRIDQEDGAIANARPNMDKVHVRVITGTDTVELALSRVPVVGETISFRKEIYVVREVQHTPQMSYAAEVTVSIHSNS